MSTEKQPAPQSAPVPVKLVRFTQPVDLPGKRGASSATNDRKAASYHEIVFVPSIRHMRVTYVSAVDGEAPLTQFVPIERVMVWEAA